MNWEGPLSVHPSVLRFISQRTQLATTGKVRWMGGEEAGGGKGEVNDFHTLSTHVNGIVLIP